jgi:exodeoxyribonuclease V alpha subunit
VGAGNFLNDIIASDVTPIVRLKHIFRQAQDSLIIVNAHRVNSGEFPLATAPNAKQDFIFIKENDPTHIPEHLRTLFGGKLQYHGITPQNTLVLVPMNRGQIGAHFLNQTLQEIINPTTHTETLTHGGTTFKVGDRVMQLRNNYDKLVFNGDIGTISALDVQDKTMTISYFGRHVIYESSECDELTLAYAVTIHKSQGSEYEAIIIPIFMQHFMLLQRNLLYTAITRAKKLCILIGQPKAIAIALNNNKGTERITFLQQFLTTDLICR